MASNDNEWVYLDSDSDDEKASPKAASAMPVPAASGDATDVVTAADGEYPGGAVGEPGCNWYADHTDDEDSCSDDEDDYSDYSNEGRLERAYESDEEEELDQVDEEEETSPEVAPATPMPLPLPPSSACWTFNWDDATETARSAGGWHAVPVNSYGDNKDEEDACSEDDDYYSDYNSNEEGLAEGDEKASPEAASAVLPVPVPADCSDEATTEVVTAADTPCSGEAVGELGCKCWYKESDEGLDQADDETEHAASDMKKLLDKLLGDDAAFDFDVRKVLDKLLDVEFDYSGFDFDMRKMLDRLRCIADRRKATRDKVYRGGASGGYADYSYGLSLGSGGGYGVTSKYYYGGISDHDDYGDGLSDHYDHDGGLSDSDYGSGRDDGCLSDFDYGSGRGYQGGLSDFDYGSSRRGYYGGISNYNYGRSRYYREGYRTHCYREPVYRGGLQPPTYGVPQNPLFKVPTEDEMLGSWK